MKRALTIAGYDPTGYAGVAADLMTFRAMGVEGVSAVTAITVQDRGSVRGFTPVEPGLLTRQVNVVVADMKVDAVKVGMLATGANARALGRLLVKHRFGNVVLDPVFRSSSGRALLDTEGIRVLRGLLGLVSVVTPNLDEAGLLTGLEAEGPGGMEAAARAIHALGPRAVVVTGGHSRGAPVDVLYDGARFYHLKGRRVRGGARRMHGTGCVFSSALAAGLAKGQGLKRAVEGAKAYLEAVLKAR